MNDLNFDIVRDDIFTNSFLVAKATRDSFGEAMVELGKSNPNIIALNANLEGSMRLTEFTKMFPERSLQVGVAEQNMASIATGLALYGKIPFICSFAAFSPLLNVSQIRMACYSQANIKIASSHYGLNIGQDGVSAQMLEDIGLLRSIPNITIITPADAVEAHKAVIAAAAFNGPVYLRFTRTEFPIIMKETAPFVIGKANQLRDGYDVTLIATGSMVYTALKASQLLEEVDIHARVINVHTVKPIDQDIIIEAAKETKRIITIEEHQVNGGLGSAVAEVVAQHYPVPMKIIGVQNEWGESGTPAELLKAKHLTVADVIQTVKELIEQ